MKNYFDTKKELEIAKFRLEALEDKKSILYTHILGGVSKQADVKVTRSSGNTDKMTNYLIETYELDRKIEALKNEIGTLEYTLKKMELAMREMKELEYQVFVMRFIDNMKVNQIAKKLGYSREQIYRIIREIQKKVKMTQNDTNIVVQ